MTKKNHVLSEPGRDALQTRLEQLRHACKLAMEDYNNAINSVDVLGNNVRDIEKRIELIKRDLEL
jgi:hypothetical protein